MHSSRKILEKFKRNCKVFPWYKTLIKTENIEDLAELPLMTADILEKFYYGTPVSGATGVYETSKTSSNRRKLISYSASDEETYLEIKTKRFAKILEGTGIKKAFIDVGVGHVCSTSCIIFDRLGIKYQNVDINLPLDEHISLLSHFKPGLLYIPPSLIDMILYKTPDPRIFGIQKIVPIGEVVTGNWVKKIAQAFGLKSSDIHRGYGMTEVGQIAVYSNEIDKYIVVDGIFVEGLHTSEIDTSLGQLDKDESILIVTSLNRDFFPALRFVTYDVVRGLETISIDGVTKQVFDTIPRRVGSEFKHGERISIYDIEHIVFKHLERAFVQARVENNKLKVGILSKELSDESLKNITVDIQVAVPEIGIMIKNGLLDQIQVERLNEANCIKTGAQKKKKIAH